MKEWGKTKERKGGKLKRKGKGKRKKKEMRNEICVPKPAKKKEKENRKGKEEKCCSVSPLFKSIRVKEQMVSTADEMQILFSQTRTQKTHTRSRTRSRTHTREYTRAHFTPMVRSMCEQRGVRKEGARKKKTMERRSAKKESREIGKKGTCVFCFLNSQEGKKRG